MTVNVFCVEEQLGPGRGVIGLMRGKKEAAAGRQFEWFWNRNLLLLLLQGSFVCLFSLSSVEGKRRRRNCFNRFRDKKRRRRERGRRMITAKPIQSAHHYTLNDCERDSNKHGGGIGGSSGVSAHCSSVRRGQGLRPAGNGRNKPRDG